jgi:predicted AlkP superfamily pyrophosphatase or phosphodiesterase
MLTGKNPVDHGIVANGWHERETHETFFWRQSNDIVQGQKIWEALREKNPKATIANLFWWFNMYSSVDYSVTPRPQYRADGRKIPDIYTVPADLRTKLQDKFGQFPLFKFWGPLANLESTKWIANAAMETERLYSPTLSFVYLPHLDYPLQRVGPNHGSIHDELRAVDDVVGELVDFYTKQQVDICVVSEYAIEEVHGVVAINKILRENDLLSIRIEGGREYLDAGASEAFAVPDHQVAHVYVNNPKQLPNVVEILQQTSGIDSVLVGDDRGDLAHARSGDIVAVSQSGYWFTHDWWNDDSVAPDYQTSVDIHRKPGYDPRELFFADGWRGSAPRIALKLLMKKLGFRTMLDVITLDPTKVKGSHGRTPSMGAPKPILIAPLCAKKMPQSLPSAALKNLCVEWVTCS